MEINTDFSRRVVAETARMEWVPSPMPGVERRLLERSGEDGSTRATSVVRYAPESRFSAHRHPLGEEFLVLEGVFSDEDGDYPAGTYVRNPPGSRHAPSSARGTTIFVKLQQFATDDLERVVVDTAAGPWQPGPAPGVERLALHAHGAETVSMLRLAPGARLERCEHPGGEEVLVVSGTLEDERGRYPQGTWLRSPPGSAHAPYSTEGCVLWVKSGHLA